MTARSPKVIVLLGMMSPMPVAGVVWQTVHYLIGLTRLGYDVYYVEAHGRTPAMLMEGPDDDGAARAVAFIAGVMRRFDFGDRWAYHARHADGRCYGMDEGRLKRLYNSAELIINLHGGTVPLPEHAATGRLVYVETDPVDVQIELHNNVQQTIDYLRPHCAFFTFGENYGRPGCRLPVSDQFQFRPTRQPVVCDFWDADGGPGGAFTTIGNWRQAWREITYQGEVYHWSKHYEFLNYLDLPGRTRQPFELALGNYTEDDRRMLEAHGWRVRKGMEVSGDVHTYRSYVASSRGEFTVAKDQNIRLRTGWFSDRSATYLAAGRPVVTQATGFRDNLPTGAGLFSFSTEDEAVAAVESIIADYPRQRRAALSIAREYFDSDVVLRKMLAECGVTAA